MCVCLYYFVQATEYNACAHFCRHLFLCNMSMHNKYFFKIISILCQLYIFVHISVNTLYAFTVSILKFYIFIYLYTIHRSVKFKVTVSSVFYLGDIFVLFLIYFFIYMLIPPEIFVLESSYCTHICTYVLCIYASKLWIEGRVMKGVYLFLFIAT